MLAIQERSEECARLLIFKGADQSLKDKVIVTIIIIIIFLLNIKTIIISYFKN